MTCDKTADSCDDNPPVRSETITGRQRHSGPPVTLLTPATEGITTPARVESSSHQEDGDRSIVDCIWASVTSTNVCRVDINNATVMSR